MTFRSDGDADATPHRIRPLLAIAGLTVALVLLAILRAPDHDESQYVAAARLVAGGLLPYRDFAYLQTPLQPFVFAPIVYLAGDLAWPALRIVNALLGAVLIAACWRAMREAGVDRRTAALCAGLLASCDILLFSAGTARNDALPAAMLGCALIPILRAERGTGSRGGAMLVGLLLAGAAAAKISYAIPAAAYGLYALARPRHRPGWVVLGALPPVLFTAWTAWSAPEAFAFGTLIFPAEAPAEYFRSTGQAWKFTLWAKGIDTAKFLALGPALVAIAALIRHRGGRLPALLAWVMLAGLIAAWIPSPVWRQYLLPALPPLFVLLAICWTAAPPGRGWLVAAALFAAAGLAPTIAGMATGGGLIDAVADTRGIARLPLAGRVATLSPQLLPAVATIDPRFATGPFYFRSRRLLPPAAERRLHLVSRDRLDLLLADPPAFILIGGEGPWTSGNAALDGELEAWAIRHGWRLRHRIGPRLRLYARSARGPSIAVR